MNTDKQRVLIVALLFLLVGSCAGYAAIDLPVRADNQAEYMHEGAVERGALLYANNCRTCHGNQGEGFVGPALNTDEWQNQDPVAFEQNREILTRTLECGRAGTLMPAWLQENGGSLNERQVEHIVKFLQDAPSEEFTDQFGEPTSHGWELALEFAHNLNADLTAVVGGDTLNLIAGQHNIGIEMLAEANDVPMSDVNQPLERGSTIQVPPNNAHPDGAEIQIRTDNDTIAKLADTLNVGATAIADLNGLDYEITYPGGDMQLLDEEGNPVPGLRSDAVLELPEGAQYVIQAEDTLQAIADQHGVPADEIREMNERVLGDMPLDEAFDGNRRLTLPDGTTYTVAGGDTLQGVAESHDVEPADLADANSLDPEVPDLEAGLELDLPEPVYIVTVGDTLQSVAERHNVDPAELAELNDIDDPGTGALSTEVVIDIPKVDEYTVEYQTLEESAEGFGNVNAQSLAQANDLEVGQVLRIGTELSVPEDAYGNAPPDAINDGSGCVEHAVPDSILAQIRGEGGGEFDPRGARRVHRRAEGLGRQHHPVDLRGRWRRTRTQPGRRQDTHWLNRRVREPRKRPSHGHAERGDRRRKLRRRGRLHLRVDLR
ncbi:MAG: LysM peptidoglycan-binding domain-containing protein [Dehalococcoidia bacterium]|nr:LysM peptidoglycan-binding domain-containing protein [Dehalococcoidia bacterium]